MFYVSAGLVITEGALIVWSGQERDVSDGVVEMIDRVTTTSGQGMQ